jgi:hypothetical protein
VFWAVDSFLQLRLNTNNENEKNNNKMELFNSVFIKFGFILKIKIYFENSKKI